MGTQSIFVLLCEVVYLVKLCSSAVIDFEKERDDLCAMAGITNRSCTESEAVLIKEGVKRKQELENVQQAWQQELENVRNELEKEEKKKDEYFKRTIRAEEQKELVEAFARQAVSPSRIRKTIERLQQSYIINPNLIAAKRGTIESEVNRLLNKIRKEILESIKFIIFKYDVTKISTGKLEKILIDKNQMKNDGNGNGRGRGNGNGSMTMEEVFNVKWSTLKTALKYHVEDDDVCRSNNFGKEDSLQTVVLKLACIETVVDANEFIKSLKKKTNLGKIHG